MSINASRLTPLRAIKRLVAPAGRAPRRVWFGIYRNLVLQLDLQSQSQLFLGLWERETFPYVMMAARRAHWMIDVGAGKGELCLVFLRRPHPIHVVAIEPNSDDVAEMHQNFALNGFGGAVVDVIRKNVSSGGQPETIALDQIAVSRALPGFIKIDVDGTELDVLRSGETLLQPSTVDVLIETHSQELETQCKDWLEQRGFATEIISNAWWRIVIPENRTIPHNRWLWATSPRRTC